VPPPPLLICNNITDVDPCSYCTSPSRDHRIVCVIEEPTNIATIEKTRSYTGVYTSSRTLSPIGGVGPEQLRIANLTQPRRRGDEVISPPHPHRGRSHRRYSPPNFATPSPPSASPHCHRSPAGSDIEYADEIT